MEAKVYIQYMYIVRKIFLLSIQNEMNLLRYFSKANLPLLGLLIFFYSLLYFRKVDIQISKSERESLKKERLLSSPQRIQIEGPKKRIHYYHESQSDGLLGSSVTSDSSIFVTRAITNNNTTSHSSGRSHRRRRVLVIAAAPKDQKHLVALWTLLECFTLDVEHVIVSAPIWSISILERFLYEASVSIPRFSSNEVSLDAIVSTNDRYDVGLWCNGLSFLMKSLSLPFNNDEQFAFGLINDSVYALRQYTSILSSLNERNVSMTSLSYSFTHPNYAPGPEQYWLESVWRGFDQTGIKTFMEYSCRPPDDPLFCKNKLWGKKGCIVENFERRMSRQFPKHKTYGLFPSDVPKDMLSWKHSFHSWVRHPVYWYFLVTTMDFPIAKVNWKGMIDSVHDIRLRTCTRFIGRRNSNNDGNDDRFAWLDGFDFSSAENAL